MIYLTKLLFRYEQDMATAQNAAMITLGCFRALAIGDRNVIPIIRHIRSLLDRAADLHTSPLFADMGQVNFPDGTMKLPAASKHYCNFISKPLPSSVS